MTLGARQRIRFGIVSDAHLAPTGTEPYVWQNLVDLPHSVELLDAGLHWLAGQRLDALVLLGDLTESADPASFAIVRERAMALGVPVAAVPGNCDVDWETHALTGFETLGQDLASPVPDLRALGPDWTLELVHLSPEDGKRLRGVRCAETSGSPHNARILLTHYPVLELDPDLLAAGFRHSGNLTNRAAIEAELRALEIPVVVVHGHLHIHDARISGNLLHLSCGALIEPPHHVSVIQLSGEDGSLAVERGAHAVRDAAAERLPVFAPLHERWTWDGLAWRPG